MKHKKDKKNVGVIIITAIIVFSMVFSIFAIMIDNQSQSIPKYNKHSFVSTNTGYKTKILGKYMEFNYYPTDVERITIEPGIKELLQNSQGIAIVFNPQENITDNLKNIDIIRYELETQFNKPTYFGITQNSDKYTLPIVDCSNSTELYPFILINISSSSSFVKSKEYPGCIIMNAKLKDLIAAKDRIVYSYYDIMS